MTKMTVRSGDGGQKEVAVEFWDYSRLIDVEGVESEEFIFVERTNFRSGFPS